MRILTSQEIIDYKKQKDIISLCSFLEDRNNMFLTKSQKHELSNWMKKINNLHHNEADFFNNFKEIFSINGKTQVLQGQEDIAGLEHEGLVLIVRQADMGVNFGLIFSKEKKYEDQIKNIETIINNLDVGFGSAKNFHSQILFDIMKKDIKNKNKHKKINIKL